MKPVVSPEDFVKAWTLSDSVEEVAARLSKKCRRRVTPELVVVAEHLYRQQGVGLKVMAGKSLSF